MSRRMSQELRIDLEMLWEAMETDKEFGTDRARIALGEILGYRCDKTGRRIEEEHPRADCEGCGDSDCPCNEECAK